MKNMKKLPIVFSYRQLAAFFVLELFVKLDKIV